MNEEETWGNINMILQKDDENRIDWMHEEQGSFRENLEFEKDNWKF